MSTIHVRVATYRVASGSGISFSQLNKTPTAPPRYMLPFSFNEKSALLLVFFIIGSTLSLLLGWKWFKQRISSDKWLAGLVLLCVLYISPFMVGYAGWYEKQPYRNILFYLPLQQLLLLGPVVYIYTKSLLNPAYSLLKRDYLHFLPALLYNTGMFIVFLNDNLSLTEHYFYADGRDMDFDLWYQWAGWVSMFYYMVQSIQRYNHYQTLVLDSLSFAEELLYRWIQQFYFVFLSILVLRVLFFILNPEWGEFGSKFWYYLSFAILFNYVAFRGYLHSIQVEAGAKAHFFDRIKTNTVLHENHQSNRKPAEPAIKNMPILLEQLEQYILGEAAYKNSTLTVSEIAHHLGTHSKAVSTIINSQFNMNFNDWVNKHRVMAVLRMFDQGFHEEQTILSIALECGFNSKSTFNRAFKKHTGTTPIQYLKNFTR